MSSRSVVVVLTLSLSGTVFAQQQPPPADQKSSDTVDTQARYQIRQYEAAVRQAVLHAGELLAERATVAVPGVQLAPMNEPLVRFVPTPEGPVFDVQIPLLLDTGPVLMRMIQQGRPQASTNVPVSTGQERVTSTGVVQADPMVPSSVQAANFDADKEYTAFARQALIDVLLDNSAAVPLQDGQRLEIAASGLDVTRGMLYPDTSRKLVLVISSADLTEFRQGKITRDEAKKRIIERKY